MIYKGKWLTNAFKNEQQAYVNAGFIVWNPKATETYTEEQLIKGGMVGIYVNPLQPNAIFPSIEDLKCLNLYSSMLRLEAQGLVIRRFENEFGNMVASKRNV